MITAGIALETPEEAGVLIVALAIAEAATCDNALAAGMMLTIAANLLQSIDPAQEIRNGLTAKAVLAANMIKPLENPKAQEALMHLVRRAQKQGETS